MKLFGNLNMRGNRILDCPDIEINNQKPTYEEAAKLENITSGETVKVAFGKFRKAISVLISHYMQKATASILGHVKLSDSAAITTAGEYALDAIEKNASIDGTLANLIAQQNSNLTVMSEKITQDLEDLYYEFNFFRWGNVVFFRGRVRFKKAIHYNGTLPTKYVPATSVHAAIMDSTANNIPTDICFIINSGGTWTILDPYWGVITLPKAGHQYDFDCTYITSAGL